MPEDIFRATFRKSALQGTYICFMRFYLIKSRENKKLIPGSIKPQTSKISRHFIHQLHTLLDTILERIRGLKKQKQK